jgi:hypothetical protein
VLGECDQRIIKFLLGEDAFTSPYSTTLSYISNPDSSIRWLYPSKMKYPTFLGFYNTSSFRAKLLSCIIKLAFILKQSKFIKSGDLNVNIHDDSRLGKFLKKYPSFDFSIFTGTVGENRKVLIEIHDKNDILVFIKIAIEIDSTKLVANEIAKLLYLHEVEFKRLVIPKVLDSSIDGIVELSNIKPRNSFQNSKLTSLHIEAVAELYSKFSSYAKWIDLIALSAARDRVTLLLGDYRVINSLEKNRLHSLAEQILFLINSLVDCELATPISLSHGDFTPWNMFISNNSLHLLDWELSENDIPLLFDFFHFIFQSEIMIEHSSYAVIHIKLSNFLKMEAIQQLVDKYKIDFNRHYTFYLISNISYYLVKYVNQVQLHDQVFWLLNVWEDAIQDLITNKGVVFH